MRFAVAGGRLAAFKRASTANCKPQTANYMNIDIISVFPEMFRGFLLSGMVARAGRMGAARVRTVDLRDFASDRRRTVDGKPYSGGPGMLMRPDVWFDAIETIRTPGARVVMTTPAGEPYTQRKAEFFAAQEHVIFVCGHYEGIDARVDTLATDFVSLGDFILTGGELPAAVMTDSIVRLLPGVLGGGAAATANESFAAGEDGRAMLEAPQYTRPPVFRGMAVPRELVSGDHAMTEKWRKRQAFDLTAKNRPDLLAAGGTFTN